MPARFIVVPQWQGSGSARAMSHSDGAHAVAGELPRAATQVLDVPVEAGDSLGTGVKRFSALRHVRELVEAALDTVDEPVILIGGDCGAAVGAVAHASRRAGDELVVLWLDAHPDLQTPETSPSGAFGGMTLRAIAGDGADGLALDAETRVPPERLVLGGARSIDEEEARYVGEHGIPLLTVEDLSDPAAAIGAIEAAGAGALYIHVDLDVLDPSALAGLSYPMPFGVDAAPLIALVRALADRFPLAGASIAGFAPGGAGPDSDDLSTILRLIGALTARPAAA
ncbi:arginase family protein [Agromyces archimandritae]|uniref:Arginase family protein n=1 Tax=Agromyces archimandritae TaxID=2781962 RepID=A0A975IP18_9MICO|nr:arginase family protein [Agromyces archimandritae]QTX05182.1 arginase family protein [Agromyces archimandritae]